MERTKARMQPYLESIDPQVWYVTNKEVPLEEQRTPAFITHNAKAKNAIFSFISHDVFACLDSSATAYSIWSQIQNIHEGPHDVKEERYYVLKPKFDHIEMYANEKANDTYSHFHRLIEKTNALGSEFKLKEHEVKRTFKRLFPRNYESIMTVLLNNDSFKFMTIDEVLGKINSFEIFKKGYKTTFIKF